MKVTKTTENEDVERPRGLCHSYPRPTIKPIYVGTVLQTVFPRLVLSECLRQFGLCLRDLPLVLALAVAVA